MPQAGTRPGASPAGSQGRRGNLSEAFQEAVGHRTGHVRHSCVAEGDPEGTPEGIPGTQGSCRHGDGEERSSAHSGHRIPPAAPCAPRGDAGSQGGGGSHLAVRQRSRVGGPGMTVSGHGSCAVAVPGGGVAVAATGGDGTTLGSVVCASGGRAARFRGCWCCRGSGADRAATAQVTASETCSCRCVTGVRAGGSWRSAAGVRPLPLRQPGGCGASVTGGGGAGASVTGSRTVTVTGASRTWSGVSRSGSCRCTVSGVSRSERRRCCGPRATWSATGCTMMTGTGASATWSATWSGRAGPAARGAGCGAGRAGASQTPPGGPRLHHPNGDYGSSCHGTRRPVQTAWPAE